MLEEIRDTINDLQKWNAKRLADYRQNLSVDVEDSVDQFYRRTTGISSDEIVEILPYVPAEDSLAKVPYLSL